MNQLYQAQTYLPSTPATITAEEQAYAERADAAVARNEPLPQFVVTQTCVDGAVVSFTRLPGPELQVLPGMALRVLQTDYSVSPGQQQPQLSEWNWRVPLNNTECAEETTFTIPKWERRDVVMLRHLLSTAEVDSSHEDFSVAYFAQALLPHTSLDEDCNRATGAGCLAAAREHFFDRFSGNLSLSLREGPDGTSAASTAGQAEMAFWFRNQYALQDADFARLAPTEDGQTLSRCADFDLVTVGADATDECLISMQVLRWTAPNGEIDDGTITQLPMPGETLGELYDLVLLRSGDPLTGYWPGFTFNALDGINHAKVGEGDDVARVRCGTQGDYPQPACGLDQALGSGFTNIDVLIPVIVRNRFDPTSETMQMVPVQMSLADFAGQFGDVQSFSRRAEWLPPIIALEDDKSALLSELVGRDQRVVFRVGSNSLTADLLVDKEALREILIAPGDIITIKRR